MWATDSWHVITNKDKQQTESETETGPNKQKNKPRHREKRTKARWANIKRIKSNLYVGSIFLIHMQGKVKYQEATGKVGGRKSMGKSQRKQTKKKCTNGKKTNRSWTKRAKRKIATTAQNYQLELNWNFILMTTFVRVQHTNHVMCACMRAGGSEREAPRERWNEGGGEPCMAESFLFSHDCHDFTAPPNIYIYTYTFPLLLPLNSFFYRKKQ